MQACANTSVATFHAGCWGLASIFVGRNSLLFTSSGIAPVGNGIVVAKNLGTPGISSSGCLTYGTIGSSGWRVQAVMPARAIEAPITLRKLRRETLLF